MDEIGECLLSLDRAGEAAGYFKLAYDILSKDDWLVANEPERLARLKGLGENGSQGTREDVRAGRDRLDLNL